MQGSGFAAVTSRRWWAALAGVLLFLGLASPADAGRDLNTFDAEAVLGPQGRTVVVGVILACTQVERVHVEVTLTQGPGRRPGRTRRRMPDERNLLPQAGRGPEQ